MSRDPAEPSIRLRSSWDENAAAWTTAVREARIPSRRAGTDAAIVAACNRHDAKRILDVGCGEGWLARALAAPGREVLGIDGSAGLIDAANALSANALTADMPTANTLGANAPPAAALETSDDAPAARFDVVSYDTIATDDTAAHGPWDLVVLNFALLDENVVPLLRGLAHRLRPHGTLLIQTVHPWMLVGDGAYASGWREETFAAFDIPFPAHMPWYYRTLGAWTEALRDAGLLVHLIEEPLHPETSRPLSLLMHCTPA